MLFLEKLRLVFACIPGLFLRELEVNVLLVNNFLVDVNRLERELAFTPRFDLDAGLADSFKNDYGLRPDQKVDCSSDALLWKN